MLDILACPMDKHHPLELYGDGDESDIQSGVLYCTECSRFYMILQGIPVLLPDELRNEKQELAALEKIQDMIPDTIKYHGKPWNISS